MSEQQISSEENQSKLGFIGHFDLLGYRSINPTSEIISVVKIIQKIIESEYARVITTQNLVGMKFCECVVYADSILIYNTFPENKSEQHHQVAIFQEFCSAVVSELFWAGLPVRGAWAFGQYYVEKTENGIYIAGSPIVEAFEFSNCVDMAGCVIAPSAEKKLAEMLILKGPPSEFLGYIQYFVPCKGNRNQKMILLNHYCMDLHYHPDRIISRQVVMEKFAEHNKRIGIEVLPKVNNTLDFFETCKPDVCQAT